MDRPVSVLSDAIACGSREGTYVLMQPETIHWGSHWLLGQSWICPRDACPACAHDAPTWKMSTFAQTRMLSLGTGAESVVWLSLSEEVAGALFRLESAAAVGDRGVRTLVGLGIRLTRRPRRRVMDLEILGWTTREVPEIAIATGWQMLARMHRLPCGAAPFERVQQLYTESRRQLAHALA